MRRGRRTGATTSPGSWWRKLHLFFVFLVAVGCYVVFTLHEKSRVSGNSQSVKEAASALWQPNHRNATTVQKVPALDNRKIAGTTPTTTIRANPSSLPALMSNSNNNTNATIFVPVLKTDIIMRKGTRNAPIVLEEYKLVFFSIQKCGGTVWKQLFRRMLGHDDWRTGPTWGPSSKTGLIQLNSFHLEKATAIMNDPNYIRGTMVRDPKRRFLSAYLDKAVKTDYVVTNCCKSRPPKKRSHACPAYTTAKVSLGDFVEITKTCHDTHWLPQSRRMDDKYFELLNFVGHLETAARDARRLLDKLGVWEQFGKSGWGKYGNESIFESTSFVLHKTTTTTTTEQANNTISTTAISDSEARRLALHYTPELEAKVEQRMQSDYDNPQFDLPLTKIEYPSDI